MTRIDKTEGPGADVSSTPGWCACCAARRRVPTAARAPAGLFPL